MYNKFHKKDSKIKIITIILLVEQESPVYPSLHWQTSGNIHVPFKHPLEQMAVNISKKNRI